MTLLDPNEKLDWMKELKEDDIKKFFTHDISMIYEACGFDVLLSLWQNLTSVHFYISTAPLNEIKKVYARKFFVSTKEGTNAKALAIKLKVSEMFIYAAQKDNNGSSPDDPKLFPGI